MRLLSTLFGLAALGLLAAGLNLIVFREDPFDAAVLVLVGSGILCAVAWLVVRLLAMAGAAEGVSPLGGLNSAAAVALFLGICVVLYAFARTWNQEWDLTQEGRRELAPQTVRMLEALNQEVEVYGLFVARADRTVDIARDKTRRFLDRCQEYSPLLSVEFFDPQVEGAWLESEGIRQVSPQGTVVLKTGGRQRLIHLSGRTARLEERDFTNALVNLVRASLPKVYFITGHGARTLQDTSSEGMALFGAWLENEAYETESLGLQLGDPRIPADCDVLVIPGMSGFPYTPQEIAAFQEYIDRGGRMLLLLDPTFPTVTGQVEQLRPWLELRFGIDVGENIIGTTLGTHAPQEVLLTANAADPELGMFDEVEDIPDTFQGCYAPDHPITRGFTLDMLLSMARTVQLKPELPPDVTGQEILRTLPGSWLETELAREMSLAPGPDKPSGSFPVAVAVSRRVDAGGAGTTQTREARLVVVGDADFASNAAKGAQVAGNVNFLLNTMAWLTENPELIAIRATGREPEVVLLSRADERYIAWIAPLGLTQVVVGLGIAILLYRRRYQ